jgi:hypothetical protein
MCTAAMQIALPGSILHGALVGDNVVERRDEAAYNGTFTVWYRPGPNYRWQGTGGLSYYDASMLVQHYWSKGWQAFIE